MENHQLISLHEKMNSYSNERLDYNQHKLENSTTNTEQSYKNIHKNSEKHSLKTDKFLTPIKINELTLALKIQNKNSILNLNQLDIAKLINQKILENHKKMGKSMNLLQFFILNLMVIIFYIVYLSQKNKKVKVIESNLERDHEKNEILIRANKVIDGYLNEISDENIRYYDEISKKINIISVTYGKKILEIEKIIRQGWLNEEDQYSAIEKIKYIIKKESADKITPFFIEEIENQLSLIEQKKNEKETLKKRLQPIFSFFKIR